MVSGKGRMVSGSRVSGYISTVLLAVSLAGCIRTPSAVSPLPYQDIPLPLAHHVYLPIAGSGIPDPLVTCFGNDKALAFYRLLVADSRQERTRLDCNPRLVAAAQARAYGLANGDPWGHTDRNGVTPNQYARRAGCELPESYPVVGNGIESLTAGMPDAQTAFDSLARSPKHSKHLFGLSDYFKEQTQIGIGYAQGSGEYQYYWSILTSPPCK